MALLPIVIGRRGQLVPIPAAQNTASARKPLRAFAFFPLALLTTELADAFVSEKANQSTRPERGWFQVDTIEDFDADGRLLSVRNRAGLTHTLSYDANQRPITVTDSYGRTLRFAYDATSGYLTSLIEASNRTIRFTHDADGNLTRVTYPDASVRQYHFEDISHRFALTGITDERGIRVSSWFYNSDGKVKRYARAGNVDVHLFSYEGNKTTVTDPLGTVRTYTYQLINDRPYLKLVTQPCSSCGSDASELTYDGRGLIVGETDFRGIVTRYERDARALVTSITQAQGTPVARTQTATYETQWHLPRRVVEPISSGSRITEMAYDGEGNALETKITAGAEVRTTSRTFNGDGQALSEDGPRSDVSDRMSMTYDPSGNLASKTDAIGHVWRYTSYDADGQLKSMTDPNGLVTSYAYDARLRLKSMTEGIEVTAYNYDDSGNLTKITLPDGSFLSYTFDNADRLIGVTDIDGKKDVFTLDNIGNVVEAKTLAADGTLVKRARSRFDGLGRTVAAIRDNDSEVLVYQHDPNGNTTSETDALAGIMTHGYDPLNRYSLYTDALQKQISTTLDPQDNLVELKDQRNVSTTFAHTGFNELARTTSTDAGETTASYNLAGQVSSVRNARDKQTLGTHDANGRMTQMLRDDERATFVYDQAIGGVGAKGRLTTLTDRAATTRYVYDVHGRTTQIAQTLAGASDAKTLKHTYNANGHLSEVVYPSGRKLTLIQRADGTTGEVKLDNVSLLSNIDLSFDRMNSWTMAGTTHTYVRKFNRDGEVTRYTSGASNAELSYDALNRLKEKTIDAEKWTLEYDALHQLKGTLWNQGANTTQWRWTYDDAGNRTVASKAVNGATATMQNYAVATTSNRLQSIDGAVRQYSATGATQSTPARTFTYTAHNRIAEVSLSGALTAHYLYDINGRRLCKATFGNRCPERKPDGTILAGVGSWTEYVYNGTDQLIGEYRSTGEVIAEYLWLDQTPVAVMRARPGSSLAGGTGNGTATGFGGMMVGPTEVFFIHTDSLETPRAVVNGQNQPVWRWEADPFAEALPNERPTESIANDFVMNLRFPGQYFDAETGLHYNHFRTYEPATGRYLEADPIGTEGGANVYVYAGNAPWTYSDAMGLKSGGSCSGPNPHGNCLTKTGSCYVYDLFNRLTGFIYKVGESCGKPYNRCERQKSGIAAMVGVPRSGLECRPAGSACDKAGARALETARIKLLKPTGQCTCNKTFH